MNTKRVVLAGGSGFIGQTLARELLRQDYEVVVLTRNLREREDDGIREVEWDGEHVGEWIQCLDGAEAVINLAGRSVNCRHTPENLREILESRVNPVRAIAGGIFHVQRPPRLWLQAGAVGFYGNRHDEWCNERTSCGPGRLAEVCRRWEETFFAANAPKTRRILFRIGVVLSRDGGALPILANYTRWFLGGAAGNGRQYLSWIHHADLVRMFQRALVFDNFLAGTYNAVAPNPETNAEFMRVLRRTLYRPWSPPVPAWLVKLSCQLTQSEASLALDGCRCAPKRFLESGFEYKFPDLRGALEDICR
ncbi:MAG: TIGR01777 family oxidoreductase [Limisphaerales bacterium]